MPEEISPKDIRRRIHAHSFEEAYRINRARLRHELYGALGLLKMDYNDFNGDPEKNCDPLYWAGHLIGLETAWRIVKTYKRGSAREWDRISTELHQTRCVIGPEDFQKGFNEQIESWSKANDVDEPSKITHW